MSEYDDAILLAGRVLDRVNADPDDDLAILARQFLRATERSAVFVEKAGARAEERDGAQAEADRAWAAASGAEARCAILSGRIAALEAERSNGHQIERLRQLERELNGLRVDHERLTDRLGRATRFCRECPNPWWVFIDDAPHGGES